MSIYADLLQKIKNRKYADITEDDYNLLIKTMYCDYMDFNFYKQEVFDDMQPLRDWIYDRVIKDIKYQRTGYLNDHFCIGVIFGIFRMFDEFNADDEFEKRFA